MGWGRRHQTTTPQVALQGEVQGRKGVQLIQAERPAGRGATLHTDRSLAALSSVACLHATAASVWAIQLLIDACAVPTSAHTTFRPAPALSHRCCQPLRVSHRGREAGAAPYCDTSLTWNCCCFSSEYSAFSSRPGSAGPRPAGFCVAWQGTAAQGGKVMRGEAWACPPAPLGSALEGKRHDREAGRVSLAKRESTPPNRGPKSRQGGPLP